MVSHDDEPIGPPPEVIEFGPRRRRGVRVPRWLWLGAAGLVAAGLVFGALQQGSSPSSAPPPVAPTGTPFPSIPSKPTATVVVDPTTVAPVVTNVGRRLLGVTAGWELFGRGLDDVVRIQLAKGRIIRTAVPPLLSSGPVSFVVGPHRVLVNPLDLVPGYVVPDGRPARRLTGVLNRGGVVLPGPMPDEVWVQSGAGTQGTMTLVGLDGVRTSTTIRLPRDSALFPSADGAGYVIVTGTGGVYDARPGGFTRITTGTVLAVGPTRWLTLECNGVHHCANVVIDRVGGTRHTLPGPAADAHAVEGVISPDGSTAAVIDLESAGRPELYLRDLRTGRQHRVSVRIDDMALDGSNVAWSPDSRWLFVTSVGGRLGAVDARTRQVHTFGASLGPILALGIRRAP